jgi:hypothetical protein
MTVLPARSILCGRELPGSDGRLVVGVHVVVVVLARTGPKARWLFGVEGLAIFQGIVKCEVVRGMLCECCCWMWYEIERTMN